MRAYTHTVAEPEVKIRPAGKGDVEALAQMLARSFDDDPPFEWILPDPATRPRRLRRFFTTVLTRDLLQYGAVDVAWIGQSVAGAALWTPPGLWSVDVDLLALAGYARAFGRRMSYGAAFAKAGNAVHPHEPNWYLNIFGVDPELQGRGIGAALLRSRLASCDKTMPAYLECSKPANVPLYEHFGFQVADTLDLPAGAPKISTMWRPAPGR